jgi:hypothetical protein
MNIYELSTTIDEGEPLFRLPETIVARTASKAKYQFYLTTVEFGSWVDGFKGFLKHVKIKKIGRADVGYYFDYTGFDHMKKERGIPFAEIGMIVEVDGKKGVIVGCNSGLNLDVFFDHYNPESNCHPYWRTKYFGTNGELIKEFGE